MIPVGDDRMVRTAAQGQLQRLLAPSGNGSSPVSSTGPRIPGWPPPGRPSTITPRLLRRSSLLLVAQDRLRLDLEVDFPAGQAPDRRIGADTEVEAISIADVVMVSPLAPRRIALNGSWSPGAAERSAVRPAWITGGELPPRPPLGVVLFPFEEVHVVTQEDE